MRVLCVVFSSSSRGRRKKEKKEEIEKGKRGGCLSGYNLNISERFTYEY
jgi:hypothetical protein